MLRPCSIRPAAGGLLAAALLAAPPVHAGFSYTLGSQWQAPGAPVRALAIGPDGTALAVAAGRAVTVSAIAEGKPGALKGTFLGSGKDVLALAWSSDGATIAFVDEGGALTLIDGVTLARRAQVGAHKGAARAVGFTLDGKYVLTGGDDKLVKAWSPSGQPFAVLQQGAKHDKAVVFVAGAWQGHKAISIGEDHKLILWDVDTQRAVRPSQVDKDVRAAAVDAGGKFLALGFQEVQANLFVGTDRGADPRRARFLDSVQLLEAATGTSTVELQGSTQDINAIAVTPDGGFVATANSAGSATVWDAKSGQVVTNIPLDHPASAVSFSADGKWLAASTRDGQLSTFQLTGVGGVARPSPVAQPIYIFLIEPTILVSAGGARRLPEPVKVETASLRIRGRVKSPADLKKLEINGQEITSITTRDPGEYEFTGYVTLDRAGSQAVRVHVQNAAGVEAEESFVAERSTVVVPAPEGPGRRIALIIGVSRYKDHTIDLKYADADARALYDTLTSPALGASAFKREDVKLLIDEAATVAAINTGLHDYLQRARENDFVVFFFAGHGAPDRRNLKNLYLLAYDTDPLNIAGTGLLMAHVREAIQQVPAKNVLVLTDACHAGGMGGGSGTRGTEVNPINQTFLEKMRHASSGLAILTASESAQLSQEDPKWGGGHGVFSHFLLTGLRGAADTDHDGIIDMGELLEFVRSGVNQATRGEQIPGIGLESFDRKLPVVIVAP